MNQSSTKQSIQNLLKTKQQGTAMQNNHLMPSKEMVKGQKGKSQRRKAGFLG